MAHSDKYQDVLIRPGMDESIDSRLLPTGTPRKLVNVRTRRAARFEKRPGTGAQPTSNLPYDGKASWVGDWNGSTVAGIHDTDTTGQDDTNVWVNNGTDWGYVGRHGLAVPIRRFGIAGRENDTPLTCESVIAVNGLLYCVFCDSSNSVIYLQERTPEGVATRALTLAGTNPRIVWTGSAFYLVYNSSGTVKISQLNVTAFTLATAVSLASAATSAATMIEAANLEGSSSWLLCYAHSATEITVRKMTGTTETSSATITTTGTPAHYAIAGIATGDIVVAHGDGNDVEAVIFNQTLGGATTIAVDTISGGPFIQLGLVRVDTDKYLIFEAYDYNSSSAPDLTTAVWEVHRLTTSGGGSSAALSGLYHFLPATKPMRIGSDGDAAVYLWMHNGYGDWYTEEQSRHVLVDFEYQSSGFGACLAGIAYEHLARKWSTAITIGSCADLGDGRFSALLTWSEPNGTSGIDCVVFSLSRPSTSVAQSHRMADTSGGALYLSGANLSDVDHPGTFASAADRACFVAENGFAHAPLVSSVGATGGALTAGQAYLYQAVYRQIDNLGRVHRSAAGLTPTGIVATGTYLKGNLYVAGCGLSNRWRAQSEKVVVEGYRSWNGGPYYFVGETDATFAANTVTLSDTISDATAEANHVLYTDLGVVPTEPPSGARLMCQGGQRMFIVGWRENVVQFSKLYLATAPWEFVDDDSFRIEVPSPITALGWMDGALVIFCERDIYLVTGDGPNDQGVGSFSDPRPLPAAVGADSPHVVEVAEGLMYKGGGTIWLLPRGFGPPMPVGDAIQETLRRFPYLRAAFQASNDDDDCTHFVLASADLPGASTYVAVRDNRYGSWSLDDIDGEVGAAAAVDGKFTWLLPQWSATTHVPARQFGVSQFQDYSSQGASTWVQQRIEMGDWRPFGVLGQGRLQRVGVLGEYGGSTNAPPLNALFTIDESVQVVQQITVSGTAGGGFFREIVPAKQAGTAFQLTIYDSQPSTFVPSHVINALGIEIDTEPGLRRPNDGERV